MYLYPNLKKINKKGGEKGKNRAKMKKKNVILYFLSLPLICLTSHTQGLALPQLLCMGLQGHNTSHSIGF